MRVETCHIAPKPARSRRRPLGGALGLLIAMVAVTAPHAAAAPEAPSAWGTLHEAHGQLMAAQEHLIEVMAAREATRAQLAGASGRAGTLVERLAGARARLRDDAVRAFVGASPEPD